MMKVLNLYAGIGGNRKLWPNSVQVTSVENDPQIAKAYAHFYPQDKLIVGDARQYLLDHYREFDAVWSSKPCQTHSRIRAACVIKGMYEPKYPDFGLYEEITFLKHFFKGSWVVENVVPYYEPLIPGQRIGRHLFWSSHIIPQKEFHLDRIQKASTKELQQWHGFDLTNFKFKDKLQVLRNCVHPAVGLHVFNAITSEQEQMKLKL